MTRAVDVLLSPFRLFKVICFWIGLINLSVLFGICVYCVHIYRSVPNFDKTGFQQMKAIAKNTVYRRLEAPKNFKNYRWAEMPEINRDLIYAIVMSEDSAFFDHTGLDFNAIANSIAENLRTRKYGYGASTISQQVVKNLFLTSEKSLTRKLKEIATTTQLEQHLQKNQILELYLNLAEFGPDIYGVYAASQVFFHKTPAEINAAEGAFIALMLPSPKKNYYAIFRNHNLAPLRKRKLRRILSAMLTNELISQEQYHQYIKYDFFKGAP